jgi:hypothetical protein
MRDSEVDPPEWFVLGRARWVSMPTTTALQLQRPRASVPLEHPFSHPQRKRLEPMAALAGSLRIQRQQGISLCSRLRSEHEIVERRRAHAEALEADVVAAEEEVEETKRLLEEGIINADGKDVQQKRKRQSGSRPPGSRRSAGGEKSDADKPSKTPVEPAPKRPRPTEGGGRDASASNSLKKTKPSTADKSVGGVGGPEKASKKKPGRKPGGASTSSLFDAGALVEVSLRLGEAYANWYHAKLVELVKNRWRVALQRRGDTGTWEPMLLMGRPATEWAKMDMMRPPPVPPTETEWSPSAGDHCELFFEDGWWKVRVQEVSGGNYTVHYAPANAVHTVQRPRLRPIFTWDMEEQKFAPIRGARR